MATLSLPCWGYGIRSSGRFLSASDVEPVFWNFRAALPRLPGSSGFGWWFLVVGPVGNNSTWRS